MSSNKKIDDTIEESNDLNVSLFLNDNQIVDKTWNVFYKNKDDKILNMVLLSSDKLNKIKIQVSKK